MKLPEMPASVATQLKSYDDTIAQAKQKLAAAEAARKELLDTFYDLKGKLIRVTTQHRRAGGRTTHFRVAEVRYGRDGTPSDLTGPRVKVDGTTSFNWDTLYGYQIRDGSWRVVEDVDAA